MDLSASAGYKLGSEVSDVALLNAKTGSESKLSELAGEKGTAVIFWNQSCPYVQEATPRIKEFASEFGSLGVNVVAIDAGVNNTESAIKEYAANIPFALLINSDSSVAHTFGATHTPHVYLLNSEKKVVYMGAFDSGENKTESGKVEPYLASAVKELLAGKEISQAETKSFGCAVKFAEPATTTAE